MSASARLEWRLFRGRQSLSACTFSFATKTSKVKKNSVESGGREMCMGAFDAGGQRAKLDAPYLAAIAA